MSFGECACASMCSSLCPYTCDHVWVHCFVQMEANVASLKKSDLSLQNLGTMFHLQTCSFLTVKMGINNTYLKGLF